MLNNLPPELMPNLGGFGVLAFVVWLIWRTYRQDKNGTDAQVDTTAVALLKEMREERRETREELGQVRERVAVLEDRERKHAEVLQRHSGWDARALALLQQHDPATATALGDPPPLYPQAG